MEQPATTQSLHPELEGLDKMSAAEHYLLHYTIIIPTDLGELKLLFRQVGALKAMHL